MCVGRVPELGHERMLFERPLDDAALNALAAPVNQANLPQPAFPRRRDVVIDEGADILGTERVKVEGMFDRNPVRHDAVYDAVTTVLIPPRTEKSPTTVILRG